VHVSVIVPAYRAEETVGACLEALIAAAFAPAEITVVDDGSPDGTVAAVRARGIEPLVPGGNRGAAAARNAGAAAAPGDVLFFVDADVLVHADVRPRLEAFFRDHPGHAGVFGSYDDAPPAPSRVSRIRNLLHHHVHQSAPGEATTFWTGCGALRRADFERAGGFRTEDEMIEDVGLGLRLARAGRPVRLDPGLLCTHLKRWTWRGFLRTDYRHRAIPWTRMMLDPANRDLAHTLNAAARGKAAVAAVALSLGGLALTLAAPAAGAALIGAAIAWLALNERRFLRLAFRVGGPAEAIAALAVLWAHYLAAGAGYLRVRMLG
jgi:GT2 family glycosyltransferase